MKQVLTGDAEPSDDAPPSARRKDLARALRTASIVAPFLLLTAAHRPVSGERAVLASVQAMFDALAGRDVPGMLAHVIPGGAATDIVRDADGSVRFKAEPYADFLRAIPPQGPRLEEALHHPQVRIDHDMAVVWSAYTFRENGKLSNCGTDSIQLIRVNGEWKILNFSWTSRRKECES